MTAAWLRRPVNHCQNSAKDRASSSVGSGSHVRERAVPRRLVALLGAAGERQQGAPHVGPGLAEALHVDVDLDVGAPHLHPRHPAHHRQPAAPCPGQRDEIGERGSGQRDRRRSGRELRQLRDRGHADLAQHRGDLAARDQADVVGEDELGLAARPPRAAPAFHDPRRHGQRGLPGARGLGHGDAVGEADPVLGEGGAHPPGAGGIPRGAAPEAFVVVLPSPGTGHSPASRSCHTTTSASMPMTPPKPAPGCCGGSQPCTASCSWRWASRSRSRGCERTRRAGSGVAESGDGSGTGEVTAPSPGSLIRCRTTITGTYPPAGNRTSSSAPPLRPAAVGSVAPHT